MHSYSLAPGTLIVLEGPDRSGKTTQREALRRHLSAESTRVMHMPSGVTEFAGRTYELLEDPSCRPKSGLAKQLAHLACHADNAPQLRRALESGAVVLDRWWWSTYAYGWATGAIPATGVTEPSFVNLVNSIWLGIDASVVFLFDHPLEEDLNNDVRVLEGYRQLLLRFPDTVRVPPGEAADVTRFLLDELARRGLIVTVGK